MICRPTGRTGQINTYRDIAKPWNKKVDGVADSESPRLNLDRGLAFEPDLPIRASDDSRRRAPSCQMHIFDDQGLRTEQVRDPYARHTSTDAGMDDLPHCLLIEASSSVVEHRCRR